MVADRVQVLLNATAIGLGIVIVLELCLPLTDKRLVQASDACVHVGNVTETAVLLTHIQVPPRWLPDVAGGYGGPNFLYYGWLGFVPAALLTIWGVGCDAGRESPSQLA
jgi:hypothetical protein